MVASPWSLPALPWSLRFMSLPFVSLWCLLLMCLWLPHLGRVTHFLSLFLFDSHPHSAFLFRATFCVIKCGKEGRVHVLCPIPSEESEDLEKSWTFSPRNLMDQSDPTAAWPDKIHLLDREFLRGVLIGRGSFPELQEQKLSGLFSPLELSPISQESLLAPWNSCWECIQQCAILSKRFLRSNSRSLRISWVMQSLKEAAKGPTLLSQTELILHMLDWAGCFIPLSPCTPWHLCFLSSSPLYS